VYTVQYKYYINIHNIYLRERRRRKKNTSKIIQTKQRTSDKHFVINDDWWSIFTSTSVEFKFGGYLGSNV